MIGEALLRDLGLVATQPSPGDWTPLGTTAVGETAWQCRFQDDRDGRQILVTVLHNPDNNATRTLYAAQVDPDDQLPRIPAAVRKGAEAFIQTLQTGV